MIETHSEAAVGGSRLGRILVIVLAGIAVLIASIAYLRPHILPKAAVQVRPSTTASITAPSTAILCSSTELKLTGVFNECATVSRAISCPAGSFDGARVVQFHGARHDFILYIEVKGGYRGPGVYALQPWPHDTLG